MRIEWGRLGAEFVIIVVGVMVALAVDRWQQSRNDAESARAYLERLVSDIEVDLADYRTVVDSSYAIDRSVQFVLQVYRGRDAVQVEDHHRFTMAVLASSFVPSPSGSDATYTDLVSSGALGLIDADLRESIIGYYQEKSVLIEGRMEAFRSAHRQGYWQLPSLILGPEVLPDLWMARAGPNEDYIPKSGTMTLSQQYINAATTRLRSVPELEQRAAQVRYYMTQRKDIYGRLLPEAAQGLLNDLKAELGK